MVQYSAQLFWYLVVMVSTSFGSDCWPRKRYIREDLHAGVVLYDGGAMLQEIGELTAKKCNVSEDRVFRFSNSERRSQLGHKAGPS